jgi:FkbM family methyltransferase
MAAPHYRRTKLKKVIYDFGSNNGDDIPYYLKKADMVVAVEANPILAATIGRRFGSAISEQRLFVINNVLTINEHSEGVPFYIHKTHHIFSQFPQPDDINSFDQVMLPSINVMHLIEQHGPPYYIKLDIEHYDQVILRDLFLHGVRPVFVSAESHSIEIFSLLVALGRYKSFNLVEGATVQSEYRNCQIKTALGEESYSFPIHSAGPFGEDIKRPWMTADNFFKFLAFEGLGWRDVHATDALEPDPSFKVRLRHHVAKTVKKRISSILTPGVS